MRLPSHAAGRLELVVAEAAKLIRYEASQRRWVNTMAAYRPYGRTPWLEVVTAERTWDSYDLQGFLKELSWSNRPRTVMLDNPSFPTSEVIHRAR